MRTLAVWLLLWLVWMVPGCPGAEATELIGRDGFGQNLSPWYLLGPHRKQLVGSTEVAPGKVLRVDVAVPLGATPW